MSKCLGCRQCAKTGSESVRKEHFYHACPVRESKQGKQGRGDGCRLLLSGKARRWAKERRACLVSG